MKLRPILEAAALYVSTPLWFSYKYYVHLLFPTPLQECVCVVAPLAHILVGHLEVSYHSESTNRSAPQSVIGSAGVGATHSIPSLFHSAPVG